MQRFKIIDHLHNILNFGSILPKVFCKVGPEKKKFRDAHDALLRTRTYVRMKINDFVFTIELSHQQKWKNFTLSYKETNDSYCRDVIVMICFVTMFDTYSDPLGR